MMLTKVMIKLGYWQSDDDFEKHWNLKEATSEKTRRAKFQKASLGQTCIADLASGGANNLQACSQGDS